jgi:ribosomal protein S18 acetylase RimI-like enzyme
MDPVSLPAAEAPAVVAVMCSAFEDYPVMRWCLGDPPDYGARLRDLVGFFVAARVLRGEPMYGLREADGQLSGAAILSWSASTVAPPALDAAREALWARLGAEARARYEAFGAVTRGFEAPEPHWHLNMIGVRRGLAGGGRGRRLLDRVHRHAAADPRARGVSLTTELAGNVALYEHVGYSVTGRARVADAFESWGMFRATKRA